MDSPTPTTSTSTPSTEADDGKASRGNDAFDRARGRPDTRDAKKRLENYARAEEILQSDGGYVPVTWVVRYAVAKPPVRGLEKNKAGEQVIEGNIYNDMLAHLYMVEKA
jgi:ABC-type oligopeptide transport system substrate-binding subunit